MTDEPENATDEIELDETEDAPAVEAVPEANEDDDDGDALKALSAAIFELNNATLDLQRLANIAERAVHKTIRTLAKTGLTPEEIAAHPDVVAQTAIFMQRQETVKEARAKSANLTAMKEDARQKLKLARKLNCKADAAETEAERKRRFIIERTRARRESAEILVESLKNVADDDTQATATIKLFEGSTVYAAAVLTNTLLSDFEPGATKVAAADKILKYGGVVPKPKSGFVGPPLSSLSDEEATNLIMDNFQNGNITGEEARHYQQMIDARSAARVDGLERKLAAVTALLEGSGPTIQHEGG